VISRIRTWVALPMALLVTLVTMGTVQVSRTGGPLAQDAAEDPGRAVASRKLGASPRVDA
jgi:hypothetical protein